MFSGLYILLIRILEKLLIVFRGVCSLWFILVRKVFLELVECLVCCFLVFRFLVRLVVVDLDCFSFVISLCRWVCCLVSLILLWILVEMFSFIEIMLFDLVVCLMILNYWLFLILMILLWLFEVFGWCLRMLVVWVSIIVL